MTDLSSKKAAKGNVILTHSFGEAGIRQAANDLTFIKGFQVPVGYVCLTDITKSVDIGRFRFSEYLAKKSTKEYFAALSSEFDIPEDQLVRKNTKLGIWVHELVMLDVAGSLDATFRVWAYQAFKLTGQGRLIPARSEDAEAKQAVSEITEKYCSLMKEHEIINKEWCIEANNATTLHERSLDLARSYMELYDLLRILGLIHKAGIPVGEAVSKMLDYFYDPKALMALLDEENELQDSVAFDDQDYSPLNKEFRKPNVLSHDRFQKLCRYVDMKAALEKLDDVDFDAALDLRLQYFADPLDAEEVETATKSIAFEKKRSKKR